MWNKEERWEVNRVRSRGQIIKSHGSTFPESGGNHCHIHLFLLVLY